MSETSTDASTPQGVTTREWNVLDHDEPYLQPWTEDEDEARSYSNVVTGPLVYRMRTRFPDCVSQTYSHRDAPATAGERRHMPGCILAPDHGAGCVRQQWAADDPDAPWNAPEPKRLPCGPHAYGADGRCVSCGAQ